LATGNQLGANHIASKRFKITQPGTAAETSALTTANLLQGVLQTIHMLLKLAENLTKFNDLLLVPFLQRLVDSYEHFLSIAPSLLVLHLPELLHLGHPGFEFALLLGTILLNLGRNMIIYCSGLNGPLNLLQRCKFFQVLCLITVLPCFESQHTALASRNSG
jgi:hypothetical protein